VRKQIRILISTVLASGLLAAAAYSQGIPPPQTTPPQPAPPRVDNAPPVNPCPSIAVRTAAKPVRDGMPVKFSASLTGGDPKAQPFYSWSLSAGTILSGQGTPNVDVDSTGAGEYGEIVASLLIGGLAPECSSSGSAVAPVAGPAKKFDEYGVLTEEEESARLDAFRTGLGASEQPLIIAYAGRTNPRGFAAQNLKKIRAYLIKAGLPYERIMTMDGGFREQPGHELWAVPIGAEPPKASPTVDPKEIVYPKPTPAPRKKP
jgi:hypothetical protein